MNNVRINVNREKSRSGFAILLVFILTIGLAAIIMVIYSGAGNPFAAWQGTERERYSDPNAMPWEEGRLIWGGMLEGYGMSGRRPPFSAQPKIKGDLSYEVQLFDDASPMGTLNLLVMKNFDATSSWIGQFDVQGRHYSVDIWTDTLTDQTLNLFSGNIYPLKIYEDDKGLDRSKLYVIAIGPYELRGSQKEDVLGGAAYVNAWISKDLSAEGTLSIPGFAQGENLIIRWGPVYPAGK
jgi:hypothetical protein